MSNYIMNNYGYIQRFILRISTCNNSNIFYKFLEMLRTQKSSQENFRAHQ